MALAIGFGWLAGSVELYIARLAGVSTLTFVLIDLFVWTTVVSTGYLSGRHQSRVRHRSALGAGTWVAGAMVLAVVGVLTIVAIRHQPDGSWDAWAIWNLRATFLAEPAPDWRNGFSEALAWSHPDYPLLIPASIARVWTLTGARLSLVPVAVAGSFTAATALLLVGALAHSASSMKVVAALGLLMVPTFVLNGLSQCADVPVAFFALATATLLDCGTSDDERPWTLAGVAAAAAAWTKNEGMVLAILLILAFLYDRWRRRGLGHAWGVARAVILGAAPIVWIVASFKLLLAPPNDLVSGLWLPGVIATRLRDTVRMAFVGSYMLERGFFWGGWPVMGPMPILLGIGTLNRADTVARGAAGRALALHVLVLAAVYTFTPHSVAWHLATSWERLLAQLWPTAVWWAFVSRPMGKHGSSTPQIG